ncbi:MAG: hypothetical protein J5J00_16780 [Deltaproteobacteria bacterium]|nr:hypothetical protein [Deltaproteobacteria bacterium]
MNAIRYWHFLLVLLAAGCGPISRISVQSAANFRPSQYETFEIKQLRIEPTYGDSQQLIKESTLIQKRLEELMEKRGYRVNPASADVKLIARVSHYDAQYVNKDELRFMKGAHGSTFPHANPRLRNYRADAVLLEIYLNSASSPQYVSSCRLYEDVLPPPAKGRSIFGSDHGPRPVILTKDVISCIAALTERIPARR